MQLRSHADIDNKIRLETFYTTEVQLRSTLGLIIGSGTATFYTTEVQLRLGHRDLSPDKNKNFLYH